MCDCLICERIELIKKNKNPYFVRELNTYPVFSSLTK